MRSAVYRPTMAASANLPFSARSTGHYSISRGKGEKGLIKDFLELYWGIEGIGRFLIGGKWRKLQSDEVCFFVPGDEHRLEAVSGNWEYRWMTIDGPNAMDVFRNLGLGREPAPAGRCPEELFAKLANEIRDHSLRGQRKASVTAYAILAEACGGIGGDESGGSMAVRCVELIEAHFQNDEMNVEWLADRLGVNRSSLSREFRGKLGVSVIAYIIACRMQHALFLLKETDRDVAEIAFECGYSHPEYFSRAFKKSMGKSPREFRGEN